MPGSSLRITETRTGTHVRATGAAAQAVFDALCAAQAPTHGAAHALHERDDGLAHCKVCGGAEGSLPTDCPGVKLTAEQEDKVFGRELDFRNGQWVDLDPTVPRGRS